MTIQSTTDATEFSNIVGPHRDRLFYSITNAIVDQQAGISKSTCTQQAGSFDRWKRFLENVGINDEWLEGFTDEQSTYILSSFASSCRRNEHGRTRKSVLTGNTVKTTITHVRSSFRTNLRHDPALDVDGRTSLFLTQQLAGYCDSDPSRNQQKALPVSVFATLQQNTFTPLDAALGQLACGAFFFGMRSCEYLTVTGQRKTKRLTIGNIRFFKHNQEITDKQSAMILFAETVSITFEFQKNKQRNITVTQPRSGKQLCPVTSWGKIVQRVLSYKGSSSTSPVNTVMIGNKRHYIHSREMMKHLQHTVDNISGLGFTGKDIGTHSIRSSFAMALYLSRRPVSTIMLMGRWSSDAFLLYIRRQVQEFSKGVSSDMVQQENFYTIPTLSNEGSEDDRLNPQTRNSLSFANTISLNGPEASSTHIKRPAMHVWY